MTTTQKTEIRNAFTSKVLTDIKLSKHEFPTIIESGGFQGALLGIFAAPLMKAAVPLAKNVLAPLVTILSVSAIDCVIQRKMQVGGVVRGGKGIHFEWRYGL